MTDNKGKAMDMFEAGIYDQGGRRVGSHAVSVAFEPFAPIDLRAPVAAEPVKPLPSARWYVIRLEPGGTRRAPERIRPPVPAWRREECVAERSLRDLGIEVYLPRLRRLFVHKRSKARIERSFPLFAGYLFAAVDDMTDWRDVEEADGVLGAVGGWRLRMPVAEVEVRALQEREAAHLWDETPDGEKARSLLRRKAVKAGLAATRVTFAPGTRVRAIRCCFEGRVGPVLEVLHNGDLKVGLEIFGESTVVILSVDQVERVA